MFPIPQLTIKIFRYVVKRSKKTNKTKEEKGKVIEPPIESKIIESNQIE